MCRCWLFDSCVIVSYVLLYCLQKEAAGALTHTGAHLDLSAFSSWEVVTVIILITRNLKVICEELHRCPSCGEWTCVLLVLLAVQAHNHSATGMLHPHRSASVFLYVTLCSPIPLPKDAHSRWRIATYTIKRVIHWPIHLSHHPK